MVMRRSYGRARPPDFARPGHLARDGRNRPAGVRSSASRTASAASAVRRTRSSMSRSAGGADEHAPGARDVPAERGDRALGGLEPARRAARGLDRPAAVVDLAAAAAAAHAHEHRADLVEALVARLGLLEQDRDVVGGDVGHPRAHARARREQRARRGDVALDPLALGSSVARAPGGPAERVARVLGRAGHQVRLGAAGEQQLDRARAGPTCPRSAGRCPRRPRARAAGRRPRAAARRRRRGRRWRTSAAARRRRGAATAPGRPGRRLAADDRAEPRRHRVGVRVRAGLGEHRHQRLVAAAGRVRVRRQPVAVARLEVGAVRDQQPRGLLPARPQQRVAQLGVGRAQVAALEQQPLHVRPPLRVAERVRVRAPSRRARAGSRGTRCSRASTEW